MKTTTRIQPELCAAAFKVAAARLEEIAAQIRNREGVAEVSVHCPDADEIEEAVADGDIFSPSLTVEVYRHGGYDASALDREFGLSRIGDGSGSFGPVWVYAL